MSPIFPGSPTRLDPYKNFKFRLLWNGATVAAFSTLSPLPPAAAHDAQKSPGRDKYEPITLERGVTHDTGFQSWASSTSSSKTKAGSKTDGSARGFGEGSL